MSKICYDVDPKEAERVPKELGKDLLEAELLGIDAYTFSKVNRNLPSPRIVDQHFPSVYRNKRMSLSSSLNPKTKTASL